MRCRQKSGLFLRNVRALVLKPKYGQDYKEDEEEEEDGVDENSELPMMSEIMNPPGGKELHELAILAIVLYPSSLVIR